MKQFLLLSVIISMVSCMGTKPVTENIHLSKLSIMLGLRTVIYKVDDIEKAKISYEKAFETKPYFDQPFYVGFNIGGYELGLQPKESDIKMGENVIAYWGVNNIEEKFAELIKLGAKAHTKPENVGGNIKTATIIDPWNNIVGIIYNPEFKVK